MKSIVRITDNGEGIEKNSVTLLNVYSDGVPLCLDWTITVKAHY
jgi:hypothetical protein